jgi:hypothetical protein
VLAVVVIAYPAFQLFILAYTGVRIAWASQEKHEVVYKIYGTADSPQISYSRDGHQDHEELPSASLPWQSDTLTIKGRNQYLSVYALKQVGDPGTVRCEIWVDGKLVESDDPEKKYPGLALSADCTHTP